MNRLTEHTHTHTRQMDTRSFPVHLEISLAAVGAPSLYFPAIVLSLFHSLHSYAKTACESRIKGSHVPHAVMKRDMKYKSTGQRRTQKGIRRGGGKWLRTGNERGECLKNLFNETRKKVPPPPHPPNSTLSPLQSESHFGSSMHRTPRWALSLTPSTPWHMGCITCNGRSAPATR